MHELEGPFGFGDAQRFNEAVAQMGRRANVLTTSYACEWSIKTQYSTTFTPK